MPTYAYQCSSCDQTFEVEQKITDAPMKDCSCGSEGSVKRLIMPLGVVFKGQGFHINDYASSGAAPAPKAPEPAATPAAPAATE